MKHLAFVLCFALFASATMVHAQESSDRMFGRAASGVYLLTQKDGHLRLLNLGRDGTASQVSPQQTTLGFTAGEGAWRRSGETEATVQIIDFDFDPRDGKPTGATLIRYVLNFSDLDLSGFQGVAGTYSGEQYTLGQNPLDPSAKAIRSFGIGFTGQRVRVPVKN